MSSSNGDRLQTTKTDQQYLQDALAKNPWKKAVFVDGELRWLNNDGSAGEMVEPIPYHMRQYGDELLLCPKENDVDGSRDEQRRRIEESNNSRVDAYVAKVALQMAEKSTKIPRPDPEEIKEILLSALSAVESKIIDDGVLAIDADGKLDVDFDNDEAVMRRETQFTSRPWHSLVDRTRDPHYERLQRGFENAFFPLKKDEQEDPLSVDDAESGYESASSAISTDHCKTSPAYELCDSSCWLRCGPDDSGVSQGPTLPPRLSHPAKLVNQDPIYQYQRIPPGHTRLLEISAGQKEDRIRCTVNIVPIPGAFEGDDSGEFGKLTSYEALSYSWGPPDTSCAIELDGASIAVSQNLWQAMRHIRLLTSNRTVWIDALCINQRDNDEKSEQVQYMYAIYRAATRVIVWLGVAAEDSNFALDLMPNLSQRSKRRWIFRHDHEQTCLSRLRRLILAIKAITTREWFSRSWIRQEIAAARGVVVKCGPKQVSWVTLKRSVNCITRLQEKLWASRSLYRGDLSRDSVFNALSERRSSLLRYLKKNWVIGQPLMTEAGDLRSVWYYNAGSLLDLLMVGRLYDATDVKDKVYCVLGMAEIPIDNSPTDEVDDDAPPTMRVDYSSTISDVYQHVAKYLVNKHKSLDILCILPSHRDSNSRDLPSWVPDWRVPVSSKQFLEDGDYVGYKWGASGFTKAVRQDQDERGVLYAQAYKVTSVVQLLPLSPTNLPHPPETTVAKAEVYEEGKFARRFAQTSISVAAVPASSLVGDSVWILLGCKMPVVLRPASLNPSDYARYSVIGPCWSPTIMFGESLESHQDQHENILLV